MKPNKTKPIIFKICVTFIAAANIVSKKKANMEDIKGRFGLVLWHIKHCRLFND